MVRIPTYDQGRLSAPATGPNGEPTVDIDHDLIGKLRAVRVEGDESLTAIEQFDPDFSVKLSACKAQADADTLLDEWLEHRVEALRRTQDHLRRVWQTAQTASPSAAPDPVDGVAASGPAGGRAACASR